MTNLFPIIYIVTLVSTNWQNIAGDWKREGSTNYVKQVRTVVTNTYVYEVVLSTNITHYKRSEALETNAVTRWLPVPGAPSPPLPGVNQRE